MEKRGNSPGLRSTHFARPRRPRAPAAATGALRRWPPLRGPVVPCSPWSCLPCLPCVRFPWPLSAGQLLPCPPIAMAASPLLSIFSSATACFGLFCLSPCSMSLTICSWDAYPVACSSPRRRCSPFPPHTTLNQPLKSSQPNSQIQPTTSHILNPKP